MTLTMVLDLDLETHVLVNNTDPYITPLTHACLAMLLGRG